MCYEEIVYCIMCYVVTPRYTMLYLVTRVPRRYVGHAVPLPVDVRHRGFSPGGPPSGPGGPSWRGTALRVDRLGR